jgi:hypothetical protein
MPEKARLMKCDLKGVGNLNYRRQQLDRRTG